MACSVAVFVFATTYSDGSPPQTYLPILVAAFIWALVGNMVYRIYRLEELDKLTHREMDGTIQADSSPLLWSADLDPYEAWTSFHFIAATADGLLVWKIDRIYRKKMMESARGGENPSWIKTPNQIFTWDKVLDISAKDGRLVIRYRDLSGKEKKLKFGASPFADAAVERLSSHGWEVHESDRKDPRRVNPILAIGAFVVFATAVCATLFFVYPDLPARVGLVAAWLIIVPLISWGTWIEKPVVRRLLTAVPVSPARRQDRVALRKRSEKQPLGYMPQ